MFSKRILSLLAAPVLLALGAQAQTTHVVTLSGVSFSPPVLKIDVGDSVEWQWISGSHNVVSGSGGVADGIFTSGNPTSMFGKKFTVVFDQAFVTANPKPGNLYPYFCQPHFAFGMVGSVQVQTPATSTSRNGSGVNPATFVETSPAVIGGMWQTTVDIVTPGALASAIAVSGIGPLQIPTGFGELLINSASFVGPIDLALGAHSIAIPNDCNLLGTKLWAQAATFKPGMIVFQNALDLELGV